MPRACSVCSHPQHAAIDQALDAGESLRVVAKRFGLNYSSVNRHRTNCVPSAKDKGKGKKEPPTPPAPPAEGATPDIYSKLEELARKADDILARAQAAGNDKISLNAISESRSIMESMWKGYEAQKRIEALYAPKETFSASTIYAYLKEHSPEALEGLIRHLKGARG